jgi:hypothetical protein
MYESFVKVTGESGDTSISALAESVTTSIDSFRQEYNTATNNNTRPSQEEEDDKPIPDDALSDSEVNAPTDQMGDSSVSSGVDSSSVTTTSSPQIGGMVVGATIGAASGAVAAVRKPR